jgi:hypothetical protein
LQVKRSRVCAKMRKQDHEHMFERRDEENRALSSLVSSLRDETEFLNKVLRTPELLDPSERQRLVDMLAAPQGDIIVPGFMTAVFHPGHHPPMA